MTPGPRPAPAAPTRPGWWWVLLACALWLAGCAQPPPSHQTNTWSGRLALQIQGQAAQSFSALFELQGSAQTGTLVLSSPLGTQLAQLDWRAGRAQLVTARETLTSESLDALLQEATGAPIPIAAVFSWIQGESAAAPGWQADLSGAPQGRIVAHRHEPAPPATLRIILSR